MARVGVFAWLRRKSLSLLESFTSEREREREREREIEE